MTYEQGKASAAGFANNWANGRDMVPLPGWVTLHSHTNYRSPRQIVDMLASIGEMRRPVEAASPFEGADIEQLVYLDGGTEAMLLQTKHAIALCLRAGFARQGLAIALFRGREKSTILGLDKLAMRYARPRPPAKSSYERDDSTTYSHLMSIASP